MKKSKFLWIAVVLTLVSAWSAQADDIDLPQCNFRVDVSSSGVVRYHIVIEDFVNIHARFDESEVPYVIYDDGTAYLVVEAMQLNEDNFDITVCASYLGYEYCESATFPYGSGHLIYNPDDGGPGGHHHGHMKNHHGGVQGISAADGQYGKIFRAKLKVMSNRARYDYSFFEEGAAFFRECGVLDCVYDGITCDDIIDLDIADLMGYEIIGDVYLTDLVDGPTFGYDFTEPAWVGSGQIELPLGNYMAIFRYN